MGELYQAPNLAPSTAMSIKYPLLMVSLIVIVTIIDSQFVSAFYGTPMWGSPSNLHLLLFLSLTITSSLVNVTLLRFVRRNVIYERTTSAMLKRIHVITSALVYIVLAVLVAGIFEIIIIHAYSKILSITVVYLSHFFATGMLGIVSFNFIQWFRAIKSYSMLVYATVFLAISFILLLTIPMITEQYLYHQPDLIYAADFLTLVNNAPIPSPSIGFIYGLGTYGLPLMIASSWILTVSMLKTYRPRIGKIKFWVLVSIPLAYQLLTFLVRDANLVNDPSVTDIIYSRQIQFLMGISYQLAGIFFAAAFLITARKIKRKVMKNYLIISALGIIALFSSMQPGMPFYASFPPFGLVTLTLLGLSSYMLLVGILGTAANVSKDTEVRQEIYKSLAESHIYKMGLAEMQREIESRIMMLTEKVRSSEDMSERIDHSKEDIKMMIDDVLKEVHSKRFSIKPHDESE
jgi:hypothetical protein